MITVIYDSDCGFCTGCRNLFARLDHFRLMRWIPLQSDDAARLAIPRQEMERAIQLVAGRRRTAGFAAFKRILARIPLVWVVIVVAVWITPWSALAIALLFSPLANPVGNRVYDWVARNRYRLPGSSCKRPF